MDRYIQIQLDRQFVVVYLAGVDLARDVVEQDGEAGANIKVDALNSDNSASRPTKIDVKQKKNVR